MTDTQVAKTLTAADPVMHLVHRAPVWVYLDTTLRACARVMSEESIGAVLVKGPYDPAGVLSERDIVAAAAGGAGLDGHLARDFMTAEVDAVDEMTTIGDAAREMLRNEIRHLAVMHGDHTVGLISMRDVLAVLTADA
jgi:CBS domain-containing protein